jgi:6-phosphogluconolactonase (cycloisomerase 2 family)
VENPGWSPDVERLAYTARRNDQWDIYTIDINGGKEQRLAQSPGLDDGTDYSPNGKHIYYNSFQTGSMEIWQMKTDGILYYFSNQETKRNLGKTLVVMCRNMVDSAPMPWVWMARK